MHWQSARAAGLMEDQRRVISAAPEINVGTEWRRCQWHIVKHSDELCVSTFEFSSVLSTKASGSNDVASSDPTHSTGAVLMTLSCILSPHFAFLLLL